MRRAVLSPAGPAATHLVFTDLDGTLLDHETYSWKPAYPALARLRALRIPVIPCSSKTAAEIRPLMRKLRLRAPYIVENGGGIRIPKGYFPAVPDGARQLRLEYAIDLGLRHGRIVEIMKQWRPRFRFRGFTDMSYREIAAECGLSIQEAKRAGEREYDEPFLLLETGASRRAEFLALVRKAGLRCVRGGRFHHLTGPGDKGSAVRKLLALFSLYCASVRSLGLGDSPNDLPMLRAVDEPVIIPHPDGTPERTLMARLPAHRVACCPGPRGWNEAVLRWLDSLPGN